MKRLVQIAVEPSTPDTHTVIWAIDVDGTVWRAIDPSPYATTWDRIPGPQWKEAAS